MIVPFPASQPDRARRVRALTATHARLSIALRSAREEAEVERLSDEIEAITMCLARAESADLDEARGKAVVLRGRMEEVLEHSVPGEALTLALAASLLRDLDLLRG